MNLATSDLDVCQRFARGITEQLGIDDFHIDLSVDVPLYIKIECAVQVVMY